MAYKKQLLVTDIKSYFLPEISDFVENLLNLYEIYNSPVILPLGYPAKKEAQADNQFIEMLPQIPSFGMSYQSISNVPNESDLLQGKYQDEAILMNSAKRRLYVVSLIKKLGGIRNVIINNSDKPLIEREMAIYFDEEELTTLYNNIEGKRKQEEIEDQKVKSKKLIIHYNPEKKQMECEGKVADVAGFEDIICKVALLDKTRSSFELEELAYELNGEMYQKSQFPMLSEQFRQATWRLNQKILKEFKIQGFFKFSQKTNILTINGNKPQTK